MLAIIQARMSSKRLPGKVLMNLAGAPVLGWVQERLEHAAQVSRILVATSDEHTDDPVVEYCRQAGVDCYRGPLDDVAQRFQNCIDQEGAEAFVRVTGDSPLIDPEIVDDVIALFTSSKCDLATNVQYRSFPKGQSVEVIRSASFSRARKRFRDHADREHITRYFYAHPSEIKIRNLLSGEEMGDLQLSIDTHEDLVEIDHIVRIAGRSVTWKEAAELRFSIRRRL